MLHRRQFLSWAPVLLKLMSRKMTSQIRRFGVKIGFLVKLPVFTCHSDAVVSARLDVLEMRWPLRIGDPNNPRFFRVWVEFFSAM